MADSRTPIDMGAQPANAVQNKDGTGEDVRTEENGAHYSAFGLRKEKIRLRCSLTQEQRRQKSAQIVQQLVSSGAWKEADSVLVYVSYGAEVSTLELIDRALLLGKKVFCPKVVEDGRMEFYRIFSRRDLKPGFRGIPEPDGKSAAFEGPKGNERTAVMEGQKANERQPSAGLRSAGSRDFGTGKKTLLIAPGTVFDRKGHRIGYGGGYYDRYLGGFSDADRPYCVGLCFSCQLSERILPEAHDVKMDRVIFDKTPGFER